MQERRLWRMRRALMRANTRRLLTSVVVFQLLAALLVALRPGHEGPLPWILVGALPLGTLLVANLMGKLWPVDRAILIFALLLCSLGLIALTDICRSLETPGTQTRYALIGIASMFGGAALIRGFMNPMKYRYMLMGLCALALLSPWALGRWYQGARNWVYIGPISGQPSEFMKPVLVVILASCFSNRPSFVNCLPGIGFAAVCCAILLSERDLGALLLYFLLTVLMYYAGSSNLLLAGAGVGMGALSGVLAVRAMPYVAKRFELWRNPWADPQNGGYQVVHALIALGSGGLFGTGLGLGMPRNVPLYHSDFIFTSIAEEFGLIFSLGVMAIYLLIIMRGLIVAMNARTSFHSLTAFGLVAMPGMQALLIIGGNTQLLPLTGVTLPLVSYGGSSLVSSLFSMGLLLGISSMNAEDEARDIEHRAMLDEEGVFL